MTSFDAFIGKLSRENTEDLSDYHGTIWDEDSAILCCRRLGCGVEFSLLVRKHHCRECGGIYCEDCAPPNTVGVSEIKELMGREEAGKWYPGKFLGRKNPALKTNSNTSEESAKDGKWYPGKYSLAYQGYKYLKKKNEGVTDSNTDRAQTDNTDTADRSRICIGCRFGEGPGSRVKRYLKNAYREFREKTSSDYIVEAASPEILLNYGSLYGEGEKIMRRSDGTAAHESGYVEILNKSDFVCAIRLFQATSEALRESARPSYFALLPQQSLYAEFDPSIPALSIATLFGNPNRCNPSEDPIFNTRGPGVTKDDISPSCAVENFTDISIHTVQCAGRNVVLKYQGQGVVDIRRLTTTKVGRGALGVIKTVMRSTPEDIQNISTLDFGTNAEDIEKVFTSSIIT